MNDAVISAKPNYATQLLGAQFLDEMAQNGFDFGYEAVERDGGRRRYLFVVFRNKGDHEQEYMCWSFLGDQKKLEGHSINAKISDIMRKHNLI